MCFAFRFHGKYADPTKLGREEFTRDIPNVSEKMLRNLDEGGIVRYRFSWIKQACAQRNLNVERLENEYGQTWLRISKR